MPMWVFDAETTQFLSVNDAAVPALRLQPRHLPAHEAARDLAARTNGTATAEALRTARRQPITPSRNWRHLKADGSEIEVLTFGRRVAFDGRDGYLVAVVDITERRKAEARIAHMAHHDGAHRSAEPRTFPASA